MADDNPSRWLTGQDVLPVGERSSGDSRPPGRRTTTCDTFEDVNALIRIVCDAVAEVTQAVLRLELAALRTVEEEPADREMVRDWLDRSARIAVLSCDRRDLVSKEHGAHLDQEVAALRRHVDGASGN